MDKLFCDAIYQSPSCRGYLEYIGSIYSMKKLFRQNKECPLDFQLTRKSDETSVYCVLQSLLDAGFTKNRALALCAGDDETYPSLGEKMLVENVLSAYRRQYHSDPVFCGHFAGDDVRGADIVHDKTISSIFYGTDITPEIGKLRFDCVAFAGNQVLAFEYDGEGHSWFISHNKSATQLKQEAKRQGLSLEDYEQFLLETTRLRDLCKDVFCAKNGIRLCRIPYYKKDEIKHIVREFFKEHAGNVKIAA